MTQLIYYAAATEDGFIAGLDGDLDWLHAYESPEQDYGYSEFLAETDGLVMGRATYEVACSFGPWPYGARPAWVLSHRRAPQDLPATVHWGEATPQALCAQWSLLGLQRVWLVGGGDVASQFLRAGLIDELILSTVPERVGRGIRLFGRAMALLGPAYDVRRYPNGLVTSRYALSAEPAPAATAR